MYVPRIPHKKKFLFGVWNVFIGIGAGVAALTYQEYIHNVYAQVLGMCLYAILLVGGLYYMAEGFRE